MALIEKHGEALIVMGRKHFGKTVAQVAKEDPNYLAWLRGGDRLNHIEDDIFFAVDSVLDQLGFFKK
jgi:hypothetical protein